MVSSTLGLAQPWKDHVDFKMDELTEVVDRNSGLEHDRSCSWVSIGRICDLNGHSGQLSEPQMSFRSAQMSFRNDQLNFSDG
jgi:hypothetical protein